MIKLELTKEISPKQLEWRNHKAVNSFTRQNGLISAADQVKWRDKIANDPSIQMFGILSDGENIGTCGLTSINLIHGTAEFSLLIDPLFHGRGLGSAALKTLLNYGFNHLPVEVIWGETFETNHALHIFKKVGMQVEGTLRGRYFKYGKRLDSISISITRDEWKQQSWSKE